MTGEPAFEPAEDTEALHLPTEMVDRIIDHARQDAPRECCGLVAGKNGRATALYHLTNLATGTKFYEIDPAQLYELEFRTLPARGWTVLAIYHSHPVSPASPSPTDVALAAWPGAFYVICSLAVPERPELRAFRIVAGGGVERPIRDAGHGSAKIARHRL